MTTQLRRSTLAGAVLAGGKARRWGGVAKGALEVATGVSAVQRLIVELNRAGAEDVIILANDPGPYRNYDAQIVPDLRADVGPLAGIEAGLSHFVGRHDAVLFVPCDLPAFTAREIVTLKEAFLYRRAPVVFAETAGSVWHPLCVVVRVDNLAAISAAIDAGRRRVRKVWQRLAAERVLFDDEQAFVNLNRPSDLRHWRDRSERANRLSQSVTMP